MDQADLLAFLEIDTTAWPDSDRVNVEEQLGKYVSDYVLSSLIDKLTVEQIRVIVQANSDQALIEMLRQYIPDADSIITDSLQSFKQAYLKKRSSRGH